MQKEGDMIDVMGTVIAIAISMVGQPDADPPPPAEAEPVTEASIEAEEELGWDDPPTTRAPAPVIESPPQPVGPTEEELARRKARSRARGMTIGGFSTFGISYLASMTIGVAAIDIAKDDMRQRRWGRRMTIPIGGPFAAAFITKSATGTMFTVLTGVAQLTGFTVGVVGAAMLGNQKRAPNNLAFAVVPDPTGLQMGASWRF